MDRARDDRPTFQRTGRVTLALMVLGGAALFALRSVGSSAGRFTDPEMGWTIEVPSGFEARPFGTTELSRGGSSGVVIADFRVRDPASLSYLGTFPTTGAALRIWHNEGGPLGPVSKDDARLPIDLESFHEIDPYVRGSEPTPLYRSFNANGTTLNAAVWFGPDASLTDRFSIASAVESLAFPATEIGALGDRLIVLGSADGFEIGSVTRYDRDDLPLDEGRLSEYHGRFRFFLVRGPSGFYAVATDFLGNGTRCDLAVEQDPLVFSCRGEGWAWDRMGSVLDRGPAWPDGTSDLLILPVPLSWDGNVMVDPFGNDPGAAVEAWR